MGLITATLFTCGIVLAQADLPNANLPGNSPTLPNSNLPGPVTTDQPIMLPNTDSSGYAITERQMMHAAQARDAAHDAQFQETMRLAAKAAEESARARAEAAQANQAVQSVQQQQQQQAAPQPQPQP